MPDRKLTELQQARAPAADALLYLVQGGLDRRVELQHLLAVPGHMDGLGLEYAGDHQVTVGAGRATSGAGDFVIQLDTPATVDLTVGGAGGLDTGTESPDTWYAVHVIGDTTGANPAAGLISTSADGPVLPAGYDRFRRVGWVRNNAAGDIRPFWYRGCARRRTCFWNEDMQDLRPLSAGSDTAWTAVDCSAFLPPTATLAHFSARFVRGTSDNLDCVRFRPEGGLADDPPWYFRSFADGLPPHDVTFVMPTSAGQVIEYRVSDAADNAYLGVIGFVDEL